MNAKFLILLLSSVTLISGCASINSAADPNDPLEGYNRAIYEFNQDFDDAIAKPVAKAYQTVTPTWVDKGLSNFFSNLDDVIILVNNLLQFKPAQAASDAARIFFNTIVGLFGLIDVSTHLEFPKHREDFGQTLGYWGVPSGPYFVLPFLGPSTIRDSAGLAVDYKEYDPIIKHVTQSATRNSLVLVKFMDTRADLLMARRLLDAAALDPYIFTREAYLQRRRSFVYDGNPPPEILWRMSKLRSGASVAISSI